MLVTAIVLAAGRGERMGCDKAMLGLGDRRAIERVVESCRDGGVDGILVVRAEGAAPLPSLGPGVDLATLPSGGAMFDSIRAGVCAQRASSSPDAAVVFPCDYAMVSGATVRAVVETLRADPPPAVVLPLFEGRPGHPIGLGSVALDEVAEARGGSLRDIVHRDRNRVTVVEVTDRWVHFDLDTPADLARARRALEER